LRQFYILRTQLSHLTHERGVGGPSVKVLDDEGGASNDVVGGDIGGGGGGGDDNVRDTLEGLGDHGHVVGIELNSGGSDTVVEDGVLDGITLSRVVEGEGGGLSWVSVVNGQSAEGLDGKSGVGGGARGDECGSNGVNHVETESGVVGGRPRLGVGDGR